MKICSRGHRFTKSPCRKCYPGFKPRKSKEIDQYIRRFPKNIQRALNELRRTIRAAAPQAEEKISYQIPTYYLNGNLVHFAAFKKHISFFPTTSGVKKFRHELSKYRTGPGTIQFPLDERLPLGLISRIVKFRARENSK